MRKFIQIINITMGTLFVVFMFTLFILAVTELITGGML